MKGGGGWFEEIYGLFYMFKYIWALWTIETDLAVEVCKHEYKN